MNKALLVSHQLDFSGAPLALLDLSRVLIAKKYKVYLLSLTKDNGLASEFIKLGVSIVSSTNLNEYNIIFFNTIIAARFIPNKKISAKVVLWIHESPYLAGLGWNKNVQTSNAAYADFIIFPTNSCQLEWSNLITINESLAIPSPINLDYEQIQKSNIVAANENTYCVIDPREDYRGVERIENFLQYENRVLEFNFVGANPPEHIKKNPYTICNYYGRIRREQAIDILINSRTYVSATCMATQNRGFCEAMALNKFCYVSDIPAHREMAHFYNYNKVIYFKPLDGFRLVNDDFFQKHNSDSSLNILSHGNNYFEQKISSIISFLYSRP